MTECVNPHLALSHHWSLTDWCLMPLLGQAGPVSVEACTECGLLRLPKKKLAALDSRPHPLDGFTPNLSR